MMNSNQQKRPFSGPNLSTEVDDEPFSSPDDALSSATKNFDFSCAQCEEKFRMAYLLKKHVAEKHRPTKLHKCTLCNLYFSKKSMESHFQTEHDITLKTEKFEFGNYEDFMKWKEHMEKETTSVFKKVRGTEVKGDVKYHYFDCHRSGHFQSRGKGQRHLKTQGSRKIEGYCPASIRMLESKSGKCAITFISTHIGHVQDIGHIPLSDSEKSLIASKIAMKIPFNVILDEVRDSISDKLERIHLLTNKDLHNLEGTFNLSGTKHSSDAVSVDAFIAEMQDSGNNSILFYKPQGVDCPESTILKKDDFMLAIMTSCQEEILKTYGGNCICMDGTHGMNSYGFELVTLLVLDDMRQGFPAAFLISNRTDSDVISLFLDAVKDRVGVIQTKVFMSDMGHSFYNGWMKSMGQPDLRLYCSWHVDRAWRKNLPKIKNLEKQVEVYKILRTLLIERDAESFDVMLKSALNMMMKDPITAEFGKYFLETYSSCPKSWAYCHRIHAGINTNMHLERMHRTLKYIYLKGKTVKRLDKALNAIMQFVKDKIFDRLIILHKGKITKKLSDLRKRHQTSLNMENELIENENGWLICSESSNELYSIIKNNESCNCKIFCADCKVCIHKFICSCPDSSIQWNMCKHAHYVAQKFSCHNDDEDSAELSVDVAVESHNLVSHMSQADNISTISEEQERLKSEMLLLISSLKTKEELAVFEKQMLSVKPIVNAMRTESPSSFHAESCSSVIKNINPQRRLFSTKKKTQRPKIITVPTEKEAQNIALSLVLASKAELE